MRWIYNFSQRPYVPYRNENATHTTLNDTHQGKLRSHELAAPTDSSEPLTEFHPDSVKLFTRMSFLPNADSTRGKSGSLFLSENFRPKALPTEDNRIKPWNINQQKNLM